MPALPPRVVEFTTGHLESLEDLEVLVACMDSPERWWNAADMALQLGLSQGAARRSLDQLARHNLFDLRVTDDVRYRFSPGTPELEADTRAWLGEYRRNPLAVVRSIPRGRSVRDFADAFRIRRK